MKPRKRPKKSAGGEAQDTPGRPTPEASRQQTHPDQGIHTGNPHIDSATKDHSRNRHHVRNEK